MSTQPGAPGPADPARAFDAILQHAAQELEGMPIADLYQHFCTSCDARLRDLRRRASATPDRIAEYVNDASAVVASVVLSHRLANGPTNRRHVRKLIDALTPESQAELYKTLEFDRRGVVTQPLFEDAVRDLSGELAAQQRDSEAAIDEAVKLIKKLHVRKAGRKKNDGRAALLATAELLHTEKRVPYSEVLPDVDRAMPQVGAKPLKTVEKLKKEIGEEKRTNPFFPYIMLTLKAEFERVDAAKLAGEEPEAPRLPDSAP